MWKAQGRTAKASEGLSGEYSSSRVSCRGLNGKGPTEERACVQAVRPEGAHSFQGARQSWSVGCKESDKSEEMAGDRCHCTATEWPGREAIACSAYNKQHMVGAQEAAWPNLCIKIMRPTCIV